MRGDNPPSGGNARNGWRGPVSRPRRLDAVDTGLIEALQRDGRDSFRSIARRLGVSEATIRARYSRLCADNILQVTGVTNQLGLGFEGAMVGIRTAGPPDPIADEIARWEEADYVVVTAGQFDLLVEVVCENRRHLLDLTNRMRALRASARRRPSSTWRCGSSCTTGGARSVEEGRGGEWLASPTPRRRPIRATGPPTFASNG